MRRILIRALASLCLAFVALVGTLILCEVRRA
jgi:hypothetical protein